MQTWDRRQEKEYKIRVYQHKNYEKEKEVNWRHMRIKVSSLENRERKRNTDRGKYVLMLLCELQNKMGRGHKMRKNIST